MADATVKDRTADRYRVEVVAAKQLEALAAFLEGQSAGGLSKQEWLNKFQLFWVSNPFFEEGRHPRGWVVMDESGAIRGFLGNIPAGYARNGAEELAYWATTWFVAEEGRSRSLDLFRKFMMQEGILFDTTPNAQVELILAKRFKFPRLASDWIGSDYSLPLHFNACRRLAAWYLRNTPMLRPLAFPACAVLKLATSARAIWAALKPDPSVQIAEVTSAPGDLDSWWEAFKSRHPFTFVRNTRSMNWVFFSRDLSGSRKVLEVRRDGALIGFACLKLIRVADFALVELVDFALLDASEPVLSTLVPRIKEHATSWDRQVAYVRTNAFSPTMSRLLLRAGFWKTRGNGRYYYFDQARKLGPSDLYATPVDGDRSLFP